jgi:hypothetical protein
MRLYEITESAVNNEDLEEAPGRVVATHPITGKTKRFRPGDAEGIAAWKATVPPSKDKPDQGELLDKYWRIFTDMVGQVYPDGDPIDMLFRKYRDFDMDKLNAAARKNGYQDPMDYWNEMDTLPRG